MSISFLDGLCNTQMLSIKYACSMKKYDDDKTNKNKRNKLIVINNRRK
jgi:hypothetical protein